MNWALITCQPWRQLADNTAEKDKKCPFFELCIIAIPFLGKLQLWGSNNPHEEDGHSWGTLPRGHQGPLAERTVSPAGPTKAHSGQETERARGPGDTCGAEGRGAGDGSALLQLAPAATQAAREGSALTSPPESKKQAPRRRIPRVASGGTRAGHNPRPGPHSHGTPPGAAHGAGAQSSRPRGALGPRPRDRRTT